MAWPGTTDQLRSLFLKGFKLSNQGKNEDPTYLGFKVLIDFNSGIDYEFGQPRSPLFRKDNYIFGNGNSGLFAQNPFGQAAYSIKGNTNLSYYSARGYLAEREDGLRTDEGGNRADIMDQFITSFRDLLENYPWFIQSIDGVDKLVTFNYNNGGTEFSPQRGNKVLTFNCLESLNLRMSALGEMYKQATFDPIYMRELVPRNLRRFSMTIIVTEIRNFFKTSRLIGSSTTLTALNNVANLVGSNNNPGNPIPTSGASSRLQNAISGLSSSDNPLASIAGNVLNDSGISSEIQSFLDQSDQSGIKPILMIQCSNCEFDFSESTPIPATIDTGSSTANPVGYKFSVKVGRVKTKMQFPNIRNDGKFLILADGWDQAGSSVETNPGTAQGAVGVGTQLLTNLISNSVNDLINEGIAEFIDPALSGLDQSLLGNIYSFNPGQLSANLSFNTAQTLFDQITSNNINADNLLSGELPNPQTMGLGGPKERVDKGLYVPPSGDAYPSVPSLDDLANSEIGSSNLFNRDVYSNSPGTDLGVPDRIYQGPNSDSYESVPGPDLGAPDRVYPAPEGDSYTTSPGPDLGVPNRVYNEPDGDAYFGSPGPDLGVPDRLYPNPEGDAYSNSPGRDLGVPDRIYGKPEGDAYAKVPGSDLGGPDRIYQNPSGDVYSRVPGSDLGVPNRSYEFTKEKVYPDFIPGDDIRVRDTVYKRAYNDTESSSSKLNEIVYPQGAPVNSNAPSEAFSSVYGNNQNRISPRGDIGRIYPKTAEDFIVEKVESQKELNLGNMKLPTKYNMSLGDFNPDENEFA
jgi:hypothetical protein